MSEDFRDRPSMLDAFGTRLPLYPARAEGRWRKRRTIVHGILLAVFLLLPWIHIGGEPLVLLDFASGQFHLFGLSFRAHDGPMLFLVLGIFALGLALLTALFGRAWCGWACPQTVFLDGVIRRIEHWVEGSHLRRRELDAAPWTLGKIFKKTLKWTLFTAFCVLLTHSLLAYFFGADRVLSMMSQNPAANPGPFAFVAALTALVLFDMAWFREQFCLIVCPYGRIQSVLMDRHTVTVQYDAARGEPRRAKGLAAEKQGACVACNRCVTVCPTGIDIRNGVQLECIACTACIDACDDVMKKTNQPEGLIRHAPLSGQPVRWLRSRVLFYAVALSLLVIGLATSLATRTSLEFTLLRALGAPAIERVDSQGRTLIANSYRLHVIHQGREPLRLKVALAQAPLTGFELQVPEMLLDFKPGESKTIPFNIEIPKAFVPTRGGTLKLMLLIQEQSHEVMFVVP